MSLENISISMKGGERAARGLDDVRGVTVDVSQAETVSGGRVPEGARFLVELTGERSKRVRVVDGVLR